MANIDANTVIIIVAAIGLIIYKIINYQIEKGKTDPILQAFKDVGETLAKEMKDSRTMMEKAASARRKADEVAHKELVELLHQNLNVSKKTLDMHEKFDENGLPLWYTPRDWQKTQETILQVCSTISDTQRDIAHILETMTKTLDKLEGTTKE